MTNTLFYRAGNNAATLFAAEALHRQNIPLADAPASDVTHLLLPVPSFEADGRIRGGGILEHILAKLPETVCVIGGNLDHPALKGYSKLDLLQDPLYLAENAAITADCALRIALNRLPVVIKDCPVLILGWGRIGKCLAALCRALGAEVTVAARKPADRALLQALGYRSAAYPALDSGPPRFRLLFNTVPAPVLSEDRPACCQSDCIRIDLASGPILAGAGVIAAKGLPGKTVPETSGALIARRILRCLGEKEAQA